MGLDEDLRTEVLAASTTLGQRCHQNVVPEHQGNTYPRCWFRMAAIDDLLCCDGLRANLKWTDYDVEFIDTNLDRAITAATAVSRHVSSGGLHAKTGTFGSGSVQGVFVEDQSDDYESRGIGADEFAHFRALRIRIATT